MDPHLKIRAVRYAAYVVAALVLLIVAAALVVPIFLDTPAVERELQAKLSRLVHGKVAWERLSIRLLPSPRGALSKVQVEIPGMAEVRAERVDAHLRLLPLFRGSAEIAEVSLSKPVVRLRIAQPGPAGEARDEEPEAGPVETYRAAIDAVRGLAPDSEVDVEDGEVELNLPDMPPVRLRELQLHGRTDSKSLALELSAASDAWSRLKVAANVQFADYAGAVKADIAGVKAQPWLERLLARSPIGVAVPDAGLRLEARSDGRTRIESAFELRARSVDIVRSAGRVRIPEVALTGKVSAGGEEIVVSLASAQLGSSRLAGGSVRYGLKDRSLATSSDFDLELAQGMDVARRLVPAEAAKALERIQPVSGRAQGRVTFGMRRSAWNVLVDVRKSDSSIGIEGLPGPVKVASVSVGVTGDAVKIERADVSLLDARATASATIGYGKRLRIEGAAREGSIGEGALAWMWKTAGAPPNVKLKTPIAVTVQQAAWSPERPLEVAATAAFDSGPEVSAAVGWTPKTLDIRRATIRDAKSDASLMLHLEKGLAQGRFSGSLQSATIGAALKGTKVPSGGVSGDLRIRVDLAHPGQGTATGRLKGNALDLTWLLGRPLSVEGVDVEADGHRLVIRNASVNWAEQRFALGGTLTRASDGAPIIDAQLTSPGVLVDALLPKPDAKRPGPGADKDGDDALWTLWPLPVRGRIALRSKFVQYGERKAEPVAAILTLEEKRAFLELQQVQLCGISFPLTAEARPEGRLALDVRLAASKQQIERTAQCLTERGVQMTGEFDLRADLHTAGTRHELLRNLEGTVEAESRKGRIMQFPMILKILSLRPVAESLRKDGVSLSDAGAPYLFINVKGRFDKGAFVADESSYRSNSVGFAASGSISLSDDPPRPYDTNLTVLVAPLSRLDSLVRALPLVGYVVGGILTSWPVRVTEDIRDPKVEAVSAGAITQEFVGMFQRTLKLPEKLLPKLESPAQP